MHRQNRINLTEERNEWLVVAFALAYISIIAELF